MTSAKSEPKDPITIQEQSALRECYACTGTATHFDNACEEHAHEHGRTNVAPIPPSDSCVGIPGDFRICSRGKRSCIITHKAVSPWESDSLRKLHAGCPATRGEDKTSLMTFAAKRIVTYDWGDLKDHYQDCYECSAGGVDEYGDECYRCDGVKKLRWGSFYWADHAECDFCGNENTHIASMYDCGNGLEWICLPCYLTHHRDAECCDLWREAEQAMLPDSSEK